MNKTFLFCVTALLSASLVFSQTEPTPQWRPVYHFTPEKNWTNDPNGLIYAEISVRPGTYAGFKIARQKDKDNLQSAETIIAYDEKSHQLVVDRTHSGKSSEMNRDKLRQTIDLPEAGENIRLDILLDKSSLEVFVNNGEQVLSTYIFPGTDADGITAFATGGSATLKYVAIWNLSRP